jgi:hypothetical protein
MPCQQREEIIRKLRGRNVCQINKDDTLAKRKGY